MEQPNGTPAQTFVVDVNHDIRAAMEESRKRSDAALVRLKSELVQAWRNMVEETSLSESLEVIAVDVHGLAREFGGFTRQERFILASKLAELAEVAGKASL